MQTNLLALGLPVTIAIVAAGVLGVSAFIYGLIRKFSRVSWASWQILIIFACTLLIRFIPVPESGMTYFALVAAGLFVAIALVLAVGGLVRKAVTGVLQPGGGFRFFDRLLGGLTALLNLAVLLATLGALALSVMYYCVPIEALDVIFGNSLWVDYGAQYAFDLFIVAIFYFVTRAGYRIGVLRSVLTVIMFAFTFLAAAGAILLVIRVPFISSIASSFAGILTKLSDLTAKVLAYSLVALVCFIILFTIAAILGYLLNCLIRRIKAVRIFNFIDGVLLMVVFFAAIAAFAGAFDFAVMKLTVTLANSTSEAGYIEPTLEILAKVETLFTSSPLSEIFYLFNPFRLLFG